jgi:hypothetical protein
MDPHMPQNPPPGNWSISPAQQPQGDWQNGPATPQGGWYDPLAQTVQSTYPGYAQSPNQTQYGGSPQPPRSRKKLWIGIGAGVLALVVIAVSVAVYINQTSPLATLNRYCDAWQHYDASKMFETVQSSQVTGSNISNVQKSMDLLKERGITASCTDVSITNQGESVATGKLTMQWTGASTAELLFLPTKPIPIALIKEDGQWKITRAMNTF